MRCTNVGVTVPAIGGDLHEPHATFGEPSREQALATEVVGLFLADPVHVACGLGFVAQVDQVRNLGLHPEGQLERFNDPLEPVVGTVALKVTAVHRLQQVELAALDRREHRVVLQVADRGLLRAES